MEMPSSEEASITGIGRFFSQMWRTSAAKLSKPDGEQWARLSQMLECRCIWSTLSTGP